MIPTFTRDKGLPLFHIYKAVNDNNVGKFEVNINKYGS